MNKTSISIVRTPFQLFNCIEATKKFNDDIGGGTNILICIYKNDVDRTLFEEILTYYQWSKVYFFKLNSFTRIFYPIILNNIFKNYKEIEYCFFGLITSYIVHSINQINAKNNILIDDCNETFLIANNIKNNLYKEKFKNTLIDKILGKNFELSFLKDLKIFTFFNLESYLLSNEVIKNEYCNFKESINNLPIDKEIFFIGSNLIDNYIEKEYFEETLKNTIKYFSDYKVIYIPHRYEDINYLKSLSIKYGFELKKFSTILELAILQYGKKPSGLVTIRSTALETLAYLYDIKFLNIIELDLTKLKKVNQVEEYKNLYNNYLEKKIPLIKVEQY
jgi:hypothetical protein